MNLNNDILAKTLTFDDVLLLPKYSEVLPSQTDISSNFSRHITLKTPICSSAMDTVTNAETAISLAQEGGIGVIHKNMSIEDQGREVKKVKKSESGMISDPISIKPDQTVKEAVKLMKENKISGLPVIENSSLVGIVTGRDIRFEKNCERLICKVMTRKLVTTKLETTPEDAAELMHQYRIEKLPVIDKDSRTLTGMFTIKDIEKARKYPNSTKDSKGRLRVAAAIGTSKQEFERAQHLLSEGVDALIIDTAHGYSSGVFKMINEINNSLRSSYSFDLIAGNIATREAAEALIKKDIDAIKVGIGPGSICTTRIIAGIGVPQFSAIKECSKEARRRSMPLISDGGIKNSGDLAKALAAGADSVMIGSLFAGTEEAPGELIIYQGKSYKTYRGMGSLGAMRDGSKDRYFQADVKESDKLVPEGIEGRVPYRGKLSDSVNQLTGGLRACMGYLGSQNLKILREKAEFIQISPQSLKESHPHNIMITRESPNYRVD